MITPENIFAKAERKMLDILLAWLEGIEVFPLVIRSDKTLTTSTFGALNEELGALLQSSKDIKGFGYRVELKEINTRKLGKQKLPERIVFDEAIDYWKYVGKEKQWMQFKENVVLIREKFPQLERWIKSSPLKVMIHPGKWADIIRTCQWFVTNPQPNCFLREIPGQPHTKFIEENKGIIEALLTELISDHIFKQGTTFEERFHLKAYERFIQVRLLDPLLASNFSGIQHIGITIKDFAELNIPCRKVLIMENKASYSNIENFLTLPNMKNALAIFGSGFHSGELKHVQWLKDKGLYYWGDIDTHGLQILSQLRISYPEVISLMMNRETLDQFKQFWTIGTPTTVSNLKGLSSSELELFQYIKDNNIRLEQERIPQEFVKQWMESLKDN